MAAATAHLLRSSSPKLKQPLSLPFTNRRHLPTQPLRFSAHLLRSSSPKLKQPLSLPFPNLRHRLPAQPLRFSAAFASAHLLHSSSPKLQRVPSSPRPTATISVGNKLPDATLYYIDATNKLQTVSIAELTANKRAILVASPEAFNRTSSQKHLLGFVEKAAEFRAKGVDTIACISVNDAKDMNAWKKNLKIGEELLLLSDDKGDFTKAIGCQLDLSDKRIVSVRSRRYAMFVEDGEVKILNLEDGDAFNVSSAEDLLKAV